MTPTPEVLPKPWTPGVLARVRGDEPIEEIVRDLFAPGGPFALAGLTVRPSQAALAALVARRVDGGGWGLGEAPTGTGKGLAYLVPAVLSVLRARARWSPGSGGKAERAPHAVVSTANIALQEQLLKVDAPRVSSLLGVPVRAALLKGRSNYVCLSRLNEARLFGRFDRDTPTIHQVGDWVDSDPTCSGDREDLPFAVGPAWAKVSVDADGCVGDACSFYDPQDGTRRCFAEVARLAAAEAEVVVCNHAYLAVGGGILAPATLLAVDEAHALEDALRRSQVRTVGRGALAAAVRAAKHAYGPDARRMVGDPVERLLDAAVAWLAGAGGAPQRVLAPGWSGVRPEAFDALQQAAGSVELLAKSQGGDASGKAEAAKLERAAEYLRKLHARCLVLAAGRTTPDEAADVPGPWALWVDRDGDSASLSFGPADVAPAIARLQRWFPRAVLTSATLAPAGSFDATRLGLGMPDVGAPAPTDPATNKAVGAAGPAEEAVLPSPYPLAQMGVLVVPRGPGPKDPGWSDWAVEQAVAVAREARGGTLFLCSSWSQASRTAMALRAAGLPWPVRLQGEAGRSELRAWFRDDVDGMLVATASFFEGLDVPGESLRCVVLDRIPFGSPGDPLEDAVGSLASSRGGGGSPFLLRSLPRACARLAQAAGRLIRSATDRGAVVLLDARVVERTSIGAAARRSLPPFPLSRDVGDVRRLLDGQPLRGDVPMPSNEVAPEPVPISLPLRRGRAVRTGGAA